jgi:hypothetical protein
MRVVSKANHTHEQLAALGHSTHSAAFSGVNKASISFFLFEYKQF